MKLFTLFLFTFLISFAHSQIKMTSKAANTITITNDNEVISDSITAIAAALRSDIGDSLAETHARINGESSYIDGVAKFGLYDWARGDNYEYWYGSQKLNYWYTQMGLQKYNSILYFPHLVTLNFGDSHTGYSGYFRTYMEGLFGNAGLGYVDFGQNNWDSPAKITITRTGGWTNRDQNAEDKYWGIMGRSIESASAADSVTALTIKYPYNKFRLWYYDGSGSFTVRVNNILKETVTLGGTNTIASNTYVLGGLGDSTLTVKVASGTVVLYGAEFIDSTMVGCLVYNLTNGGSLAMEWVDHLEYFKVFLDSIGADLQLFNLGINDLPAGQTTTEIAADLETIIDSLQSWNSYVPIVTTLSNRTNSASNNDSMLILKSNHKEWVETKGTSFFSFRDLLPDATTGLSWSIMNGDLVHPNGFGYILESLFLVRMLTEGFDNYASKKYANIYTRHNSFRGGLEIRAISTYQPGGENYFEVSSSSGTPSVWSDGSQLYIGGGRRLYFSESSGVLGGNHFYFDNSSGVLRLWGEEAQNYVFNVVNKNFGFNTTSWGTNAAGVIGIGGSNITAPTTVIAGSQLWSENAVGATKRSLKMMNADGAEGFVIHDVDLAAVAVGADTTWNSLDGWYPLLHPTTGDTIWVPGKLNP